MSAKPSIGIAASEAGSAAGVLLRTRLTLLEKTPVRIIALVLLFATAAVIESLHITAFRSGDVWWHLRTGIWMLQNHAIPHLGLFSQVPNNPWVASSWLFDLVAGGAYKLLGLRAVPVLLMVFRISVAVLAFVIAQGTRGKFWGAVLLSLVAQYVIVDLQPLPGVLSVLLFGVELILLLHSRQSGDLAPLFFLPPLFALWANLDVQFINGIALLILFIIAGVAERELHRVGVRQLTASTLPLGKATMICGAAALSTLINPFGIHLLPAALQESYSSLLFRNFSDMHPLGFRRPQDFVFALLVLGAFFTLGRQRSRDLFKWSLLTILLVLAFRIQRDVPYAVFAAIALIPGKTHAVTLGSMRANNGRISDWGKPATVLLVLAVFLGATACMPGNQELMDRIGATFPVRACDFIRANQLPQPLFNAHDWGGFLTWYLPEYSVSIDGRLNLYGTQYTDTYFKVVAGTERLETLASFNDSRTILLERNSGMAKALATLPVFQAQYRVAYQDDIATVLVRQ
jgi:hypothetical protein